MLAFFHTVANLKRTPRTGWLDRGLPPDQTESVADHSFMTALIAWIVALNNAELDADRVLKLALIHDLAESIVGDRPPYEHHDLPINDPDALRAFFSERHVRSPENQAIKRRDEHDATAHLIRLLPDSVAGEITALLREYEERSTPEARFVKNVDNLEAFLQSRAYLREHPEIPVGGYRDMAEQEIDDPELAAIRDAELAGDASSRTVSHPPRS